jgi:hypothetical protein
VALGCGGFSLLVDVSGVRAAEPSPSNLDVMTRLTTEVVTELQAQFAPHVQNRSVTIKPFGAGEDYLFVGNVLVEAMTRAGLRTTRGAAPGAPQSRPLSTGNAALDSTIASSGAGGGGDVTGALVLEYQTIAFQLGYTDVYRSHLIGGKHVKRDARVRIFATLSNASNGQVLWTGEAHRDNQDNFERGDTGRVEAGNYAFLRPEFPSSGFSRYAEPVFVTAIVVGLIYLFFANQSSE